MVAIVDQDASTLDSVARALADADMNVMKFRKAAQFKEFLRSRKPDVLIIEIDHSRTDGMSLLNELREDREYESMYIVVLSERTGETDRVLSLDSGADDYVAKPFSTRELVARVRAMLRRERKFVAAAGETEPVRGLDLDRRRFEVICHGKRIQVSAVEFKILDIFLHQPGRVFGRNALIDLIWGERKEIYDRTIDVHIKNLRKKLGKCRDHIATLRGVGYKLVD